MSCRRSFTISTSGSDDGCAPSSGSSGSGRKRYQELRRRGVDHDLAARAAGSGHGPWRVALTPAMHVALPNAFFTALGLPSLVVRAD